MVDDNDDLRNIEKYEVEIYNEINDYLNVR